MLGQSVSDVIEGLRESVDSVIPGAGTSFVRADAVFRTQITPDVRVDLLDTLQPAPPREPGIAGRFANWVIGSVIKPEIQLDIPAAGIRRSIAPYGPPTKDYTVPLAFFAGIGIVTVGASLYMFFRRR